MGRTMKAFTRPPAPVIAPVPIRTTRQLLDRMASAIHPLNPSKENP
jgi:hypothetical protein